MSLRLVSLRLAPRQLACLAPVVAILMSMAPASAAQDAAAIERRLVDAVRLAPDSFDAHHALAELYLKQGKLPAAIPHLERAQAIDPAHDSNNYDLAVAYLETGRLDDARALVQRLLAAKSAGAPAAGPPHTNPSNTKPPNTDPPNTNATHASPPNASPPNAGASKIGELRNLLGDVEARAGNFVAAAEPYQLAAHLSPTEEHLFDWGNNLLQLRAYEPAADVFTAAIKRHPSSARLHVGLGIAQYSRGRYEEAVRSFCQAADLAPSDPRPYQFLGEMYGVSPALAGEVTTRLARFVRAQPKNAQAHYYYAMNLWKGQPAAVDFARVEALLRRAVALDPRFAKGFLELGILLSDRRRYPAAIRELQAAIALEPDLAQAHFRLAQAYQRTGQPALAAKAFERFEQLKPSDPERPVP